MTDALRPEHSPLGASGAERWMECPGSVALLRELELPESDEEDYRREGTAMHEAAEHCLNAGLDTWEIVGQVFNNTPITDAMATAIQVYLDVCRKDIDSASFFRVEFPISSPIHPQFYGKADFVAMIVSAGTIKLSDAGKYPADKLVVRDLKGGEGIIVEPEENPQLKYYGYGVIDGIERGSAIKLRDDLRVVLEIAQPRAWHAEGKVRSWETTVGEIKEWVHDTLIPAMARTEYDNTLEPGPWCRFCPAKLVCPMLTSLFRAAACADPGEIANLSDKSIGRSFGYIEAVKFYLKALGEETERRLMAGKDTGGAKLVKKKANRVFKEGAAELARARFGADAVTKPELKSPPELERLSPAAAEFVKEWCYSPDTGLTVAPLSDRRAEVKLKPTAESFAPLLEAAQALERA